MNVKSQKEGVLIIKKLEVGPIMANCFILGCETTKEAAVIDPGDDADRILMTLAKENLTVKYLVNTHGHFDHVGANKRMKEVTGAPLAIHTEDVPMLSQLSRSAASFGLAAENSPEPDLLLHDGDTVTFGDITLKVIHTPGHSRGGICLYTQGHLFAGDTLFAGSIGRTDLPGGDYDTLIASIKEKLLSLPDDTIVYTGHGPETTIANEKRMNPFLR
jgi:hydroxyacylglutathione hydrolase